MATELEIKLSVSEAAQAQALKWLSSLPEVRAGKTKSLINHYFDTPNADLNRAKAALSCSGQDALGCHWYAVKSVRTTPSRSRVMTSDVPHQMALSMRRGGRARG